MGLGLSCEELLFAGSPSLATSRVRVGAKLYSCDRDLGFHELQVYVVLDVGSKLKRVILCAMMVDVRSNKCTT